MPYTFSCEVGDATPGPLAPGGDMQMTFTLAPAARRDHEFALLVPAQQVNIAATLSPLALADAKDLLDDRGWVDASTATGDELIALIGEALETRDVFLC